MLHVGIIGCGKIAQVRHLPEYAANPGATVIGVYDLNEERMRQIAEKYQVKAYKTYQAMLADPEIDAVSVCAANTSHAEITCAALEAGKHVLCEKPMATTLADCEAMVAAAKKSGKYLMIDQNQRLAGAHAKARELIQKGVIGKVLTFRTTFAHSGPENWTVDPGKTIWFFDKKRAAMGVLADLGIHKTDLIQYLTGERIVETTAKLATLDKKTAEGQPIDVDDNAWCIYRLESGAMGVMNASWTNYGPEDNSTVIFGTKGTLRLYGDPRHALAFEHSDGCKTYYDVDEIQTNDNQTKSGVIDLFVRCCENPALDEMSGESVLKAMRAVFASIESSETGRTVRVKE